MRFGELDGVLLTHWHREHANDSYQRRVSLVAVVAEQNARAHGAPSQKDSPDSAGTPSSHLPSHGQFMPRRNSSGQELATR